MMLLPLFYFMMGEVKRIKEVNFQLILELAIEIAIDVEQLLRGMTPSMWLRSRSLTLEMRRTLRRTSSTSGVSVVLSFFDFVSSSEMKLSNWL